MSDEAFALGKEDKPWYGLPSSHCVNYFNILIYVLMTLWYSERSHFGLVVKILSTLIGLLIGLILCHSRYVLLKHFLNQVLLGASLGCFIGCLIYIIVQSDFI